MKNVKANVADFTGELIYVGLDVHKKSWTVTVRYSGMEHKTWTLTGGSPSLVNYLTRNYPGGSFICAYEAGFCGFSVQRELFAAGLECIVVHPADIPTTQKEKEFKTDARDSRKIARALEKKELEAIYVPDEHQEEYRALVRLRGSSVGDRARTKNRIKSLLMRLGIEIPKELKGRNWTRNFINWLKNLKFAVPLSRLQMDHLLRDLAHFEQQISQLEAQLKEIAKSEPFGKAHELLCSVSGIGWLSSITILSEIGQIERFANQDKLASFVGLSPRTHSSGAKENVLGISNRGNRRLRYTLVECAWIAIRKDPGLARTYGKLTKRMIPQKVIIKIARKLLNRIRAVLISQEKYKTGRA